MTCRSGVLAAMYVNRAGDGAPTNSQMVIVAGTALPQYNNFLQFCGSALPGAMLCGEAPLPQYNHSLFRWFCGNAVPGVICCGVASK